MPYNQVFLDIFYPLTTPKFLPALKSPNDCRQPQPDIDFIRGWCAATCMNSAWVKIDLLLYEEKLSLWFTIITFLILMKNVF